MIRDEEKSFFNKHEQTVLKYQAYKNRTGVGEYASVPKSKNEEDQMNGYNISSAKANPKGYFWSAKLGTSGSRKLSASPQPEIRQQPRIRPLENDKVVIVKKNFRPTKLATLEKTNETNPIKGSDFMKLKHKGEDFLHVSETTEKYIIRPRCPLPQINKNTSLVDGHFRLKDTSTLSFLNDSLFESKQGRSKNYFSDMTGPPNKNYFNSRTKTDFAETSLLNESNYGANKPSHQRQKSVAPLKNRGNSLINQQKLISNSPISFQNLQENTNILSNSGDAFWKHEINNKSPFEFKDDILLLPSFPDKRRIKTEVSSNNEGLFQEIFELLKDPTHTRNKTPARSPNALPDKEPNISTTQYKKNAKSFKTQIKKTILMDEHLAVKSPEVKKKFQFIVKAMIQERNIIRKDNSSKKVSLPPSRKKASRSNTPNDDALSSSTIETKSRTTKDLREIRKSPYIGSIRRGFLQNEDSDKSPHTNSHKKTLKALEDHLLLQQGKDDIFTGWEEPANDDFLL